MKYPISNDILVYQLLDDTLTDFQPLGDVNCRFIVSISRSNIGTFVLLEQDLHYFAGAVCHGNMKWCFMFVIKCIQVAAVIGNVLHQLETAFAFDSRCQWGIAVFVDLFHPGSTTDEQFDTGQVAVFSSVVQFTGAGGLWWVNFGACIEQVLNHLGIGIVLAS
ncbi:hypothetical protein TYRP_017813 [Tyrophagus putrescentiae]|nr:hypothetical protein TYRP_017813 [Tyrophagus putrescentiae]